MKKILILAVCICLGSRIFAQSLLDLSLGFQYGTARVTDNSETLRKITEPGILLTFRMVPNDIGFFARVGLLFPSSVIEGDLTLTYAKLNYILFINGGLGVSLKVPMTGQFSLAFDMGMSINDLLYGGSYKETIDTRWEAKLENIGQTYSGGHEFKNVPMSESYNDVALGLLGNAAARFHFTSNIYLEVGIAASFDFLRFKTYNFSAVFNDPAEKALAEGLFPKARWEGNEVIFESDTEFSIFKQFTFIPSLSIGFSL
jgi:hypothetical protein